jgi:peptide/nickel transport system ATP-binding protein
VLSLDRLSVSYARREGTLRAVDGVSFDVASGETVGLVGESGCGKSTLGKAILRLVPSHRGRILIDGVDISGLEGSRLLPYRRRMQMVFQDPYASLNPRQSILQILDGPLAVHGVGSKAERRRRIEAIIDRVGLASSALERYPHEFSGGQRQRIGIARALVLRPDLVVCDEPVSSLDVSIQAQILNLLGDLKSDLGLSYLFISHDLAVVRYIADRVLVMYLGEIVESAGHDSLFARPHHPYTRTLFEAVPLPDPSRSRRAAPLAGDLPSAVDPPSGCRFHPRCPIATELCSAKAPALRTIADGHRVACHHA